MSEDIIARLHDVVRNARQFPRTLEHIDFKTCSDAVGEIERLRGEVRELRERNCAADDQFFEISNVFGELDARHCVGPDKSLASMVREQVERLRGQLEEKDLAIDALNRRYNTRTQERDEAREASRQLHAMLCEPPPGVNPSDYQCDVMSDGRLAAEKWPWLAEGGVRRE